MHIDNNLIGSESVPAEDWRVSHSPSCFADLIGHEDVLCKLEALVATGRPFHIILSGPSGVGKTTIARLLAQVAICLMSKGLSSCGVCHSCHSIRNVRSHQTYHEIDAPGRMGSKDELNDFINRTLRFAVPGYPYHVVFLDEAALLSIYAASLLLKLMEDPGSVVCFIFALLDESALPEPLRQRCVSIKLQARSVEQKITGLKQIAKAEQLIVEPEAFGLIAQQSASLRTATAALQQIHELLGPGETITAAALKNRLYAAMSVAVIDFFAAALNGDMAAVFMATDRMDTNPANRFRDIQRLLLHLKTTRIGPYLVPPSDVDSVLYTEDDMSPLLGLLQRNAEALSRPVHIYLNDLLEHFAYTPPPSTETFATHATLFVELCQPPNDNRCQPPAAQLAALPQIDEPYRSTRLRRPRTVRRKLDDGGLA